VRIADSFSDPTIDIGPPVPDVLADPKPHGTLPSVAPRIQGSDRELEELRELFDSEEAVVVVHRRIIRGNPVA
jgi:hypothetical protein